MAAKVKNENVWLMTVDRAVCPNCKSSTRPRSKNRTLARVGRPEVVFWGVYINVKWRHEGEFCAGCVMTFIDHMMKFMADDYTITPEPRCGYSLPDWFQKMWRQHVTQLIECDSCGKKHPAWRMTQHWDRNTSGEEVCLDICHDCGGNREADGTFIGGPQGRDHYGRTQPIRD